jgi:hypothetical protein
MRVWSSVNITDASQVGPTLPTDFSRGGPRGSLWPILHSPTPAHETDRHAKCALSVQQLTASVGKPLPAATTSENEKSPGSQNRR